MVGSSEPPGDQASSIGVTVSFDVALPFADPENRGRPFLRLLVTFGNGASMTAEALVDTGADMTVLGGRIAFAAGIDFTRDYKSVLPLSGIGGPTGTRVFVHSVSLTVGTAMRYASFVGDVGFLEPPFDHLPSVLGR